ncbi:arginine--tRNA ligase [Actinocorallia lasiicapitis]
MSLAEEIEQRLSAGLPPGQDPLVRRSDRADFQANGLLAAAKRLGTNPRELAERAVAALDDELFTCEVSGPGFLNLTVRDDVLLQRAAAALADPRLGVPAPLHGTTVVDYSQPNIAKEMHVGHLRSTIIGDALARILGHLGENVIRQNHLGDWGTQFGILIEHLADASAEDADHALEDLVRLYREAKERFDDDREFATRARERVRILQSGDPATLALWQRLIDQSKIHFTEVYDRLDVLLTDEDAVGESFYNPMLGEVTAELERLGVARIDQGALCVFTDEADTPLIIRKSDGGHGYATTDLAAVRHRVRTLGASRILYVTDARQALHFRQVFAAARAAGWLGDASVEHIPFGMVLGEDGRPFKTRSGTTVRLIDLIDDATAHARALSPDDATADQVAVGALKYADLSNNRTKNYVFSLERMVSLTGDTGVYLQYAHARTRSILARTADRGGVHPQAALTAPERELILKLDEFGAALLAVARTAEPHRLCTYLYELSQTFAKFFENCPVLKAAPEARPHRLLLTELTAETLSTGLGLLGIAAPPRL